MMKPTKGVDVRRHMDATTPLQKAGSFRGVQTLSTPKSSSNVTMTPSTLEFNRNVSIADLSEEDKMKITKLAQKVIDLGQLLEQTQRQLETEREQHKQEIQSIHSTIEGQVSIIEDRLKLKDEAMGKLQAKEHMLTSMLALYQAKLKNMADISRLATDTEVYNKKKVSQLQADVEHYQIVIENQKKIIESFESTKEQFDERMKSIEARHKKRIKSLEDAISDEAMKQRKVEKSNMEISSENLLLKSQLQQLQFQVQQLTLLRASDATATAAAAFSQTTSTISPMRSSREQMVPSQTQTGTVSDPLTNKETDNPFLKYGPYDEYSLLFNTSRQENGSDAEDALQRLDESFVSQLSQSTTASAMHRQLVTTVPFYTQPNSLQQQRVTQLPKVVDYSPARSVKSGAYSHNASINLSAPASIERIGTPPSRISESTRERRSNETQQQTTTVPAPFPSSVGLQSRSDSGSVSAFPPPIPSAMQTVNQQPQLPVISNDSSRNTVPMNRNQHQVSEDSMNALSHNSDNISSVVQGSSIAIRVINSTAPHLSKTPPRTSLSAASLTSQSRPEYTQSTADPTAHEPTEAFTTTAASSGSAVHTTGSGSLPRYSLLSQLSAEKLRSKSASTASLLHTSSAIHVSASSMTVRDSEVPSANDVAGLNGDGEAVALSDQQVGANKETSNTAQQRSAVYVMSPLPPTGSASKKVKTKKATSQQQQSHDAKETDERAAVKHTIPQPKKVTPTKTAKSKRTATATDNDVDTSFEDALSLLQQQTLNTTEEALEQTHKPTKKKKKVTINSHSSGGNKGKKVAGIEQSQVSSTPSILPESTVTEVARVHVRSSWQPSSSHKPSLKVSNHKIIIQRGGTTPTSSSSSTPSTTRKSIVSGLDTLVSLDGHPLAHQNGSSHGGHGGHGKSPATTTTTTTSSSSSAGGGVLYDVALLDLVDALEEEEEEDRVDHSPRRRSSGSANKRIHNRTPTSHHNQDADTKSSSPLRRPHPEHHDNSGKRARSRSERRSPKSSQRLVNESLYSGDDEDYGEED